MQSFSAQLSFFGCTAFAVVALHFAPSLAFAQPSVMRLEGSLHSVAAADTGGWKLGPPSCSASDGVCDYQTGWPPVAADSGTDTDYKHCESQPAQCEEALFPSLACAEGELLIQHVSPTLKEFVWFPKAHGSQVCLNDQIGTSETLVLAYNDLLLKIVDTLDIASRRYRVDVQVELVAEDNYVDLDPGGDGGEASSLTITVHAGVGDSEFTRVVDEACITTLVSDFDTFVFQTAADPDEFADCQDLSHDPGTTWTTVGYICKDAEFRFGFEMRMEGTAIHDTAASLSNAACLEQEKSCTSAEPLHVILRVRGVPDGTCP